MLDNWYSRQEIFDNKLDAMILRQQAQALTTYVPMNFKAQPNFSPSATDSCPRELYVKMKGAKRDVHVRQAHQGRWTRLGTLFGDMIQRDLLFIEKYVDDPPFIPARTDEGYPMWEDFAKKLHVINDDDVKFALFGKPDGILIHQPTGKRVGLEIKTKQTTHSRTSLYTMRNPEEKHVTQCVAYAIMYDVDEFLIVYGNLSKKSWNMTDEEYENNPDIRVFHVTITDEMKHELIRRLGDLVRAVNSDTPPPLDLSKWTFNNYKTACALSLTDDEFADIERQVTRVKKSRLPEWMKAQNVNALEFIRNIREGETTYES